MAGRPGLYDELARLKLVKQGRAIALGDGSDSEKASAFAGLLRKAGSSFNVTPRSVFILRHKFQESPDAASQVRQREPPPGSLQNRGTGKKSLHPHDGRRDSRPPPGPHSTGFKPGNDAATITGVRRNPLLRGVSDEKRQLVAVDELSPADLMKQEIEVYRLLLMDLMAELEVVKASTETWVWLGSTYTRQEGDGELMGTGRIAQRKRMPRVEAIFRLSKDLAYVQAKADAAIHKWYEQLKAAPPSGEDDPLDALVNTLAESRRTRDNLGNGPGGEST